MLPYLIALVAIIVLAIAATVIVVRRSRRKGTVLVTNVTGSGEVRP